MTHEEIERRILDRNWTEADLREAAEIFAAVDRHPELRQALAEMDDVRRDLGALQSAEATRDDPPPGGWASFEDRLIRSIAPPARIRAWGPVAAAVLLVAAVSWWSGRSWAPGSSGEHARAQVAIDPLTGAEAQGVVDLLDEVNDTLDDRVGWVAVSEHAADLGLGEVGGATPQDVVVLRLVLRDEDADVSVSDLAIREGALADFRVPLAASLRLHHRVSVTGGDRRELAIWTDVEPIASPGRVVATLGSTVPLDDAAVHSAGRIVTAHGPYELLVSARPAARGS